MIPGSIILGVAAVVDAMSAHHPCEPSLVVELALDEISQNRGILFDPLDSGCSGEIHFREYVRQFLS